VSVFRDGWVPVQTTIVVMFTGCLFRQNSVAAAAGLAAKVSLLLSEFAGFTVIFLLFTSNLLKFNNKNIWHKRC
jgi:hypothetical protein